MCPGEASLPRPGKRTPVPSPSVLPYRKWHSFPFSGKLSDVGDSSHSRPGDRFPSRFPLPWPPTGWDGNSPSVLPNDCYPLSHWGELLGYPFVGNRLRLWDVPPPSMFLCEGSTLMWNKELQGLDYISCLSVSYTGIRNLGLSILVQAPAEGTFCVSSPPSTEGPVELDLLLQLTPPPPIDWNAGLIYAISCL